MRVRQLLKELHKGSTVNKYKMNDYHFFKDKVPIIFSEPLATPDDFRISKVLKIIQSNVPEHLFLSVKKVQVGHILEFDKRDINAMYKDGVIYITNQQDDEMDMADDIVHELAHATEESFFNFIYGDGTLEQEFSLKRKKLYKRLKEGGFLVKSEDFLKNEYDLGFDQFLFKQIGYPSLKKYLQDLFVSCYSVTSLREYYAVGFTNFFLYDKKEVGVICPILYEKIANLIKTNKREKIR